MRHAARGVLASALIIIAAGHAGGQQVGPTATVLTNCKAEIEAYCADITPGEDRLAACLYANEYKLSPRCEQALFDATNELERAVADVTYVVNECRVDIANYCSKTGAGEGRLMACLDENRQRLSARCKLALQDGGAKK